ncbi:MAG: insulinase family protein [Candidatus Kapabacteria bacterium]|nr:insulinase family protein [Ignavibacteriota bacterium]MCW5885543.1 insulinase family protein [Candidatus Kapabacteria bacterium]
MYNKSKAILISLILIVAFYLPAISQKVSGYDLNAQIPMKQEVKTGTLSNGLKYFILPNSKPENRADLQIVVRAGSIHEDDDQAGLAHFLEHMAFNGTKNFPKDKLVGFLEETGMRFGADVNANTGFDRTYYMITIPLDKEGLLEKGFQVLQDWLSNISFDPEEIEKERGVIMEEWRLYQANANGRTQQKHLEAILGESKFAKRFPIGDTTIIQTAPREAFTRFFNDFYRPNLSAVIVVGDINVDEMENYVKKYFGSIKNPDNPKKREDYNIPINSKPVFSIASDKELPTPSYMMVFKRKADKTFKEGTYGEYRQSMIKNLFNTVLSYRLQEFTRKSDAPFIYAGGGYDGFLVEELEAFNLIAVPKIDKIEESYKKILEEGLRFTRFGVTKSELDRAKTEILRGMKKAYDERDKTESGDLARELYRHFHEKESVPGIEAEYKIHQDMLPEITVEEINAYLKPLMSEAGLVVAASFPEKPEVQIPSESKLLALYQEVQKMDIKPYEDVDADKPLMTQKPKAGKIVSKKKNDKLDVTELTLSNNVKVYLKSTDFKNDQILLRAWGMGGTSLAADNDYHSASMAASIVNESGLGDFDATTLTKMMQGKVANVSPYISDISEGMSGSASPEDIELMFQMIYMYFNNPRKDKEAFDSYMSRVKESIQNAGSSPDRVFSDTVSAVLGGHHFRSMPWTVEALGKVNLDKAFDFYKSRFTDAADFTFTFVGNFKQEEIEPLIETYIASLSSSNTKNNFKDNGIRMPKESFVKEVKKGIEPKSTVRLILNGTMDNNLANRFALRSLVEVMNIRLREVIREDMGGVYGIGARPTMNKYPAQEYNVGIFFGTSPEKVKDLITAAKGVIDEMKKGTFEDINIDKVKEIMKREYEVNMKDNRFWMNSIYSYLYNNEDINYILETNKMIDNVTKDYVVAAANKYLDMNTFKEFILYPED